ncbi:MAG: hypothetical protein IJ309_03780 [Clostridia bacterium]|nr:hypothetical protein [Clostridia bacterium]
MNMNRIEDLIKYIALIWAVYPFASIGTYFSGNGFKEFSWGPCAVLCGIFTIILIIVYIIIKAKRRNFEVEIYYRNKLDYNEFLKEFQNCKKAYIFEHCGFIVRFDFKDKYSYAIIKDEKTIKQESFSNISEFSNAKIISGKNLSELWIELDFVCYDSIIRENFES